MLHTGKNTFTPEEYFEMEETADCKSEYYHGQLFAMTGASHAHNVIAANITAALHGALQGRQCFVYAGDMKVQADPNLHYTYPDVSVVCGDVQFFEGRDDVIANPVVIVEVLSKSTMNYDRGGKFRAYRRVPSLRDSIVVDQYAYFVEHYRKKEDLWVLRDVSRMNESLFIESLKVSISMEQIYLRIDL